MSKGRNVRLDWWLGALLVALGKHQYRSCFKLEQELVSTDTPSTELTLITYGTEPGEAGLGYGMGAVMVDLALSLRIGVVARREALAGE